MPRLLFVGGSHDGETHNVPPFMMAWRLVKKREFDVRDFDEVPDEPFFEEETYMYDDRVGSMVLRDD